MSREKKLKKALKRSSFTVSSFDECGNQAYGDESVDVQILGSATISTSVTDQRDGTYLVSYVASPQGTYSVYVMINGEQIAHSPFTIHVIQASHNYTGP